MGADAPSSFDARMRKASALMERRLAMSSSDQENKQRNREIAENEAKREMVSNVRVSVWAIVATIFAGVIVLGIVWAWVNR